MKLTPFPLIVCAIRADGLPAVQGTASERVVDLGVVVAVDLADCPTEVAPLVGQRFEVQDLFDAAETLYLVVIDDGHEIVELVVRGKQCGLPRRAFVAFAVAQQHHRPKCLAAGLCGQCHSAADRQPMSERTGGNIDPWHSATRNMAGQPRAVGAVRFQPLPGEESAFRQRRVHCRSSMSLAENHAIAGRPIWPGGIDAQDRSIQNGQDVGYGKTRPDVRGPRAMDHAQRLQPNRSGKSACLVWIGRRLMGHGCKTEGVLSALRCQATVFSSLQ